MERWQNINFKTIPNKYNQEIAKTEDEDFYFSSAWKNTFDDKKAPSYY